MNLPEEFINKTKELLGNDWEAFRQSLSDSSPISLRINPSKVKLDEQTDSVKWCNSGLYLNERPSYTFDPLFHAGCYYPQEASSMFIEQAIKEHIQDDIRILDLCAAPGGKSTHILSLLDEQGLLVSNEVIRSRANILSENVQKSGYANTIVTNSDPSHFGSLNSFFDIILVDAPCSGEGMFRKDKEAINEWSLANVQLCKERQQRILADVWSSLKPNGILIYSTCTYNTAENEDNVEWICSELGAECITLNIPSEWKVTAALKGNRSVYRFLPHKTKGEGFFMAVLRKSDEEDFNSSRRKNQKKDKQKKEAKLNEQYKGYILNNEKYDFRQEGTSWVAFDKDLKDDYYLLQSKLKFVSYGINIGEEKGKDFIPNQSLALSINLNRQAFIRFEVDWSTAISYLRKEAVVLSEDVPKGYVLITYKNKPLGFVKNIGNRANNLYPQEWRIRSSNIPEETNSVIKL